MTTHEWIGNSLGTYIRLSLDPLQTRRYLKDILSRSRGLHHLSKLQSWITMKVTNDGEFRPRHRAWETTWVATIALSQATRFWWRDTHCTIAVWRWLITVADRTHTRVSWSNASTHTGARVRASAADNESLVVVQIWIFDGRKPRGVRTTWRPRSWLIEK